VPVNRRQGMSRRYKLEARPEGLPPPTHETEPFDSVVPFRVSVSAGVPAPYFATRFRGTGMPATMLSYGHVARTERRELYASLESRPRSGKTRLQEAAPTGACHQSSGSPPRAPRRGSAIAITEIGAHGHRSAKHRTSADHGAAVVTSSVGDDLGRDSLSFGGVALGEQKAVSFSPHPLDTRGSRIVNASLRRATVFRAVRQPAQPVIRCVAVLQP
jgi:hypothetical protein